MPSQGTVRDRPTKRASRSNKYGSLDKTNLNAVTNLQNNARDNLLVTNQGVVDNDSGMSSGENDDSLKCSTSAYNNNNNNDVIINVSSSVLDEDKIINKCLNKDKQCAVYWNEIPSCSNDFTNNNIVEGDIESSLLLERSNDDLDGNRLTNAEFIVIDLTCNVNDVPKTDVSCNSSVVGTNVYNDDCDNSSILSVDSSQCLVPVNNEIVKSESQKLVSLSLSILLAALLQAMRCFAQFLEDIVIPQRH